MDGRMVGWLDGWMDGRMVEWLDDWMAGLLDVWMKYGQFSNTKQYRKLYVNGF